jgi:hypothetical protein
MKPIDGLAFGLLFWLGMFLVFGPYFYWQHRKGKSVEEIVGGKSDPVRQRRFISGSRAALVAGVVVIGLFVAWVHWRYP